MEVREVHSWLPNHAIKASVRQSTEAAGLLVPGCRYGGVGPVRTRAVEMCSLLLGLEQGLYEALALAVVSKRLGEEVWRQESWGHACQACERVVS